jgi:hypothetical protein
LQNTCKTAGFLSSVCSGLHKFSSPVVSEVRGLHVAGSFAPDG